MSLNRPLMALTATATSDLRNQVQAKLGMTNPVLILKSPDKINLIFANFAIKNEYDNALKPILMELMEKRTLLPRIIIYCNRKADCGKLYTYFRINMGIFFTEPPGASDKVVECRLVDMFFSGTDSDVKSRIISNFTKPSPLRIVIATTAFGLGIDCHDVRMVIHLGTPSDIESYVQGIGRAGRDNIDSFALLLYTPKLMKESSKEMVEFAINKDKCRRDVLFSKFDEFSHSELNQGCKCCDICLKSCNCGKCEKNISQYFKFLSHFFCIKH